MFLVKISHIHVSVYKMSKNATAAYVNMLLEAAKYRLPQTDGELLV